MPADTNPDSVESRLKELRSIVVDLAAQLEANAAALATQRDTTDQHLDALTSLCEAFSTRLAAVEGTPAKPAHTDPAAVAEWVDGWLIPAFDLSVTLAGWASRPSYVSELTAAYIGHQHITSDASAPFDAMVWHGYLAAALDRIRNYHRNTTNPEVLELINRTAAAPPSSGRVCCTDR